MKTKRLFIFSALIFCCVAAFGSGGFKLYKNKGHFFAKTDVNGIEGTEVLIETGYKMLTLSEDNFDKLLSGLQLDTVDFDKSRKLRLDNSTFNIKNIYRGRVGIGSMIYDGEIFVIEGNNKLVVPVHRLKNEADTASTLIRFNFKDNTLDYINRHELDRSKMKSYHIVRYDPYPTFEAKLKLSDTYGHEGEIEGNWIFDLGSGTPVFFFRRCIAPFIIENEFRLLPSFDRQGKRVGEGLYAASCKIGDRKMTEFSIGITNRVSFDYALGCVGPAFFGKSIVVLDPEGDTIYYK